MRCLALLMRMNLFRFVKFLFSLLPLDRMSQMGKCFCVGLWLAVMHDQKHVSGPSIYFFVLPWQCCTWTINPLNHEFCMATLNWNNINKCCGIWGMSFSPSLICSWFHKIYELELDVLCLVLLNNIVLYF